MVRTKAQRHKESAKRPIPRPIRKDCNVSAHKAPSCLCAFVRTKKTAFGQGTTSAATIRRTGPHRLSPRDPPPVARVSPHRIVPRPCRPGCRKQIGFAQRHEGTKNPRSGLSRDPSEKAATSALTRPLRAFVPLCEPKNGLRPRHDVSRYNPAYWPSPTLPPRSTASRASLSASDRASALPARM